MLHVLLHVQCTMHCVYNQPYRSTVCSYKSVLKYKVRQWHWLVGTIARRREIWPHSPDKLPREGNMTFRDSGHLWNVHIHCRSINLLPRLSRGKREDSLVTTACSHTKNLGIQSVDHMVINYASQDHKLHGTKHLKGRKSMLNHYR